MTGKMSRVFPRVFFFRSLLASFSFLFFLLVVGDSLNFSIVLLKLMASTAHFCIVFCFILEFVLELPSRG